MSLARAYVTLQASLLLLAGVLSLLKTRTGTLGILGWLWACYALYLFAYPYFYRWEWVFLRDSGSYLIFSAFMLAIASQRLVPHRQLPPAQQ